MKIHYLLIFCLLLFPIETAADARSMFSDSEGLASDIPEPPNAGQELPSPIPVIYHFMDGIMGGDQDKCLVNFHVKTFLTLLFKGNLKELMPGEDMELYAFQTQVQRNEFYYLSRIMKRLAKDATLDYSNPRFNPNNNSQAKIVINIKSPKGNHQFEVYTRYTEGHWQVYDYVLNQKRFSLAFQNGLGNMDSSAYVDKLRPVYGEKFKYKPFKNDSYGLGVSFPDFFKVKEKVSDALLFSVSAFEGQFLLHVQGAVYDHRRTLNEVASEIKKTIIPFQPKLFDQWREEVSGQEMGQVIFQFTRNGKKLFTHMIIIPLAEKLVVMNFYHSTFQLLKNMTNIREKILDQLQLAKVFGGTEITIPADDASLPSGTPSELPPYSTSEIPPPPDMEIPPPPPGMEEIPPPPDYEDIPPPPDYEDVPPPPDYEDIPPPPDYEDIPPPPDYDDIPPPPPAPDEDIPMDSGEIAPPPGDGGGKDVSF